MFVVRKIIGSIRQEYIHIRDGIKSISYDVIGGTGAIVSLLTFLTAMICFVILIIQFALAGGYNNMFSDVWQLKGNAGSYFAMPYLAILGGLNLALLLISYILYFKNQKWGWRIAEIVSTVAVPASLIMFLAAHNYEEKYYNSHKHDEVYNNEFFQKMERIKTVLMWVFVFAIIISIVLLLIRERKIASSFLRMLILSFCVLPILTLCVENIAYILGLCALVLVATFFCVGLSGLGSSNSNPGSTEGSVMGGSTSGKQQAIMEIDRKYLEGCAAIRKANGDNGAQIMLSDKTKREISQLRKKLETESERSGVRGKTHIY